MVARNCLPRCIAFYNRIPIESLTIPDLNAVHLGKKSIFESYIFYNIFNSYSAAAIITREGGIVGNVPYLDKFAVSLQNQGLGAGETIWERIKQDFPKLFWRSRGSNRINPW